jgi:N,N'-diacetyllegionaminate synthase
MGALNLRAIPTMAEAFKLPVGYSDHSKPPSFTASIAAVALGACVIERHLVGSRKYKSNDAPNSLEPAEFAGLVREIRNTELALGNGIKQPFKGEHWDRWARPTVHAARSMAAGDVVTAGDVITLRPWGGIEPKDFHLFRGMRLIKPVGAREALTPGHFMG